MVDDNWLDLISGWCFFKTRLSRFLYLILICVCFQGLLKNWRAVLQANIIQKQTLQQLEAFQLQIYFTTPNCPSRCRAVWFDRKQMFFTMFSSDTSFQMVEKRFHLESLSRWYVTKVICTKGDDAWALGDQVSPCSMFEMLRIWMKMQMRGLPWTMKARHWYQDHKIWECKINHVSSYTYV